MRAWTKVRVWRLQAETAPPQGRRACRAQKSPLGGPQQAQALQEGLSKEALDNPGNQSGNLLRPMSSSRWRFSSRQLSRSSLSQVAGVTVAAPFTHAGSGHDQRSTQPAVDAMDGGWPHRRRSTGVITAITVLHGACPSQRLARPKVCSVRAPGGDPVAVVGVRIRRVTPTQARND